MSDETEGEIAWWDGLQRAYAGLPCRLLEEVLDSPRARAAARLAMIHASLRDDLARWADDGGR